MNITLHIDGKPVMLENLVRKAGGISFTLEGKTYAFTGERLAGGAFVLAHQENGVDERRSGLLWQQGKQARVQVGALEAAISESKAAGAAATDEMPLSPTAPMPGLVRQVLVKPGDKVKKGQALAVMEAMKLHTTLAAGADAMVEKVLVREGEQIAEGALLVRLKAL